MGWKASCLLVNEREPGYLGTLPRHDPARAARLADRLGLGRRARLGPTTFDAGLAPDTLTIGAYDGAAIVADPSIVEACLTDGPDPLTARVLAEFPRAAVLRLGLQSVINLWSYTLFESGRLVRAYGGTADDGVVLDRGALLPEEQPHFARSTVRDGVRIFTVDLAGETHEFAVSSYGETLTFAVMARFLGGDPTQEDLDPDPFELAMESFGPTEARRWWWPFR